jgi:hypothetical protein
MAIAGETLNVSDIAGARRFNRRTGAPAGSIELRGESPIDEAKSPAATIDRETTRRTTRTRGVIQSPK